MEYWSHAAESLSHLSNIYVNAGTSETIGRVNRLLSAWPADDNLPAEGYESVKTLYKKLTAGLNDIKTSAERDAKSV